MAIALPEHDLQRLYLDGIPAVQIAKQYGVSANTVRRRLQKLNTVKPLNDKDQLQRIIALYRSGLTIRALAQQMKTSDQTINRRLRAAGETIRVIRRKGPYLERRKPLDLQKLRDLRDAGLSTRAIGEHFGVSEECVRERMIEAGIPRLPTSFPGELNPAWRGGRPTDKDGYILVHSPGHPSTTHGNYVREHRLVMEQKLGRVLLRDEVVHHIDGNRANNHPDNLELFSTNADHLRSTLLGCVPEWTEDGRRRMREGHPARRAERESSLISSEPDALS